MRQGEHELAQLDLREHVIQPDRLRSRLLLDHQEAIAVAVGLRAAAAGAVAGVESVAMAALAKPPELRDELRAVGRRYLRAAEVRAAPRR